MLCILRRHTKICMHIYSPGQHIGDNLYYVNQYACIYLILWLKTDACFFTIPKYVKSSLLRLAHITMHISSQGQNMLLSNMHAYFHNITKYAWMSDQLCLHIFTNICFTILPYYSQICMHISL